MEDPQRIWVRPVDAQGERAGRDVLVNREFVTQQRRAFGPGSVAIGRWGGSAWSAGQWGMRMLNRQCSFGRSRCGYSVAEAARGGVPSLGSGMARVASLRRLGWGEIADAGQLRADDLVVWSRYGSNPTSAGYTHGHIGFVVFGEDGQPYVASNFNGNLDVRALPQLGGRVHAFRSPNH